MSTQLMTAAVSVDGVPLGVRDDDGLEIGISGIDGWYSGTDMRASFTDRTDGHGSYDAPTQHTARVVTLTGWLGGDTRAQVARAIHRLKGILGQGQLGTVRIDDPDFGALSTQARLAGKADVQWNTYETRADWQAIYTAPDPMLYADPVTLSTGLPQPGVGGLGFPLFRGTHRLRFGTPGVPGQVTMVNPGTADTWLTFTVTGPLDGGFSLTDLATGRRIVYAGDVPDSGTVVIVDTAYGRATLNGADRSGELTVKQWWPVPRLHPITEQPGTSTVQFAALGNSDQDGSLTATIQPAYW